MNPRTEFAAKRHPNARRAITLKLLEFFLSISGALKSTILGKYQMKQIQLQGRICQVHQPISRLVLRVWRLPTSSWQFVFALKSPGPATASARRYSPCHINIMSMPGASLFSSVLSFRVSVSVITVFIRFSVFVVNECVFRVTCTCADVY